MVEVEIRGVSATCTEGRWSSPDPVLEQFLNAEWNQPAGLRYHFTPEEDAVAHALKTFGGKRLSPAPQYEQRLY